MRKFKVKRSEWNRGVVGASELLNDAGRCCLGFVAQQCGVPDEHMRNVASPKSLLVCREKLVKLGLIDRDGGGDTALTKRLIKINDYLGDDPDPHVREAQLNRALETRGIAWRFEFED